MSPDQTEAGTQQDAPGDAAPMGEASEIPPLFYWILWVPAFAVTIWGMQVLFGRFGAMGPEPPDERPPGGG